MRQRSDYAAEFSIFLEDANEVMKHANIFVNEVKDILKKKYAYDA